MSACTGNCCAVFSWSTPPDKLRARWAGIRGPLSRVEAEHEREDLYIADMLIKLTPEEVSERLARWDFKPAVPEDFDLVKWAEESAYTCRHWDEDTKLCTAYEERPKMCRDYPYEAGCSLDCSCAFRSEQHVRTEWSAIRVKHVVKSAERETPRQGSDLTGA